MSPNRAARIRAMARSFMKSVAVKHTLGDDYIVRNHFHLQDCIERLTDEEVEIFNDELDKII